MQKTILFILAFITFSNTVLAQETAGFDISTQADETTTEFVSDGAWCWFADPRAIHYNGVNNRTYVAFLTNNGSVRISQYDHNTKEVRTKTIREQFELDDHANPSLLILPDGRIMIFYSGHNGSQMYFKKSKNAEDIGEWDSEKTVPLQSGTTATYPNVAQLSDENNRIYIFYRGIDWNPTMSYSDDEGESWSTATKFIHIGARPYLKSTSNGKDRIHITFTDGHPRNEINNHVYYVCLKNGGFYKADGTFIKNIGDGYLTAEDADLAYDASAGRGWVWDVAYDSVDKPIIVHTALPSETDHRYRYAKWTGTEWVNNEITNGGKWFPQTPDGETEVEPHYSAGVILDHNDPTVVYLSRPTNDIFEIEKWTTSDNGTTWTSENITSNSTKNNVRPISPINHKSGEFDVVWMYGDYINYQNYATSLQTNMSPEQIIVVTDPVAQNELISNLQVFDNTNASKWSLKTDIQAGSVMYGDRNYTLTSVPSSISGGEWIKTACNSRTWVGTSLVTFNLLEDATVYVAHNDLVTSKPSWFSNFTNTGEQIETIFGQNYTLYKRDYSAGTVSLGQNADGSNTAGCYIVVAVKKHNAIVNYALATGEQTANIIVNGVSQSITFPSTGSVTNWDIKKLNLDMEPGTDNTVTIELSDEDISIDYLQIVATGIISNAETAELSDGFTIDNANIGFSGSGYVISPLSGGTITFNNVDDGNEVLGICNPVTYNKSTEIYPNPNNGDVIFIKAQQNSEIDVNIHNIAGHLVYSSTFINSLNTEINIENLNLTSGAYILNVRNNDINESHKLVIN